MSEPPPPYFPGVPGVPGVPSAPGCTSDVGPPRPAFPGTLYQVPVMSPLQTFPQTYEGDYSYYQGPAGRPEACLTQPAYQGFYSGAPKASFPWDSPKTYGDPPKPPVYVVEQNRGHGGGGGGQSFLSPCSAAMCCCCLWNMLKQYL